MTTLALFALFINTSQTYGLPYGLLSSVCYVESHHKTKVVNHHDGRLRNGTRAYDPSVGMCQIKLTTAKQFEPNITHTQLLNPKVNARIAAKYLQWQLDRYDNDIPAAVAAYNAGSCRFNKRGQIKNREYVRKVFSAWISGK